MLYSIKKGISKDRSRFRTHTFLNALSNNNESTNNLCELTNSLKRTWAPPWRIG